MAQIAGRSVYRHKTKGERALRPGVWSASTAGRERPPRSGQARDAGGKFQLHPAGEIMSRFSRFSGSVGSRGQRSSRAHGGSVALPKNRYWNKAENMHISETAGVDPNGLREYSVVFTDRALNHMSQRFQQVMRDLSKNLKAVYHADAVALVPGGGTTGMESVARQFAHDRNVLIIRNGWFSYRWSQIFEIGRIPARTTVLKARPTGRAHQAPFAPPLIDEVIAAIAARKPDLVFAPHVETSSDRKSVV